MLRVRWLGRVPYREAHALQRALHRSGEDYLLLLEHDHVYTLGVRARPEHVLAPPEELGAEVVKADRGGDVTYHGPGQLVGYPIVTVPMGPDATPRYVHQVEQVVIDALGDLGLPGAGRMDDYPGVWVDAAGEPRKIAAIGVRLSRGRTMHGFALNVDPDMAFFSRIVPCGIAEYPVTSLRQEGIGVSLAEVGEAIAHRAAQAWGTSGLERQDVAWRSRGRSLALRPGSPDGAEGLVGQGSGALTRRMADAGVAGGLRISERKPAWLRAKARIGPEVLGLRKTLRDLSLVTVCEEAGCPNLFECWKDGTATFMINGERCTRACGFCLVDTRHPLPIDPQEPERVAEAVERLGLSHAVVTAVARDDLPDGGAGGFVSTVEAIRRRRPGCAVELLIPDCKGDRSALSTIFSSRPDVLNHNLETVARLQRAIRPSAGYARSLAVLARAKEAGLVTKSGMVLGMGETNEEVLASLADLAAVGVDIVTLGQYLRPSEKHVPVDRWLRPEEFSALAEAGMRMGLSHVEASPLTRSSYHARQAAEGAGLANVGLRAG